MPDTRSQGLGSQYPRRENVFIDSYRILDSCKDKDCFEDTRLILTDMGQEILEKSGSIRVTDTKIIWCDITTEPIKFNRGFYQVTVRFFTKVTCEACICANKVQQIEGVCVNEKKVVLYGGEGCVNIFRSSDLPNEFCTYGSGGETSLGTQPTVIVEAVDPIALSVKVAERSHSYCCCSADEIPSGVLSCFGGSFSDSVIGNKAIYVTLGYFSIIRVERPAQFIISASEYAVPDKVCCKPEEDDPCKLFAKMNFPSNEFSSNTCCTDCK